MMRNFGCVGPRAILSSFFGVQPAERGEAGSPSLGPTLFCVMALLYVGAGCASTADSTAHESTGGASAEEASTADLPPLILPENPPHDEVVVRTARLWDVSQESAALRLRLQDADGSLAAALADRFPEVFVERKAGLRGEHIYLLSEEAPELRRAITEVYRDAGVGPEHLVFEQVPLSSEELRAREEAATRVVSRQAARHGVTHWFVDTDARSGQINVEIDERNPEFSEAVRDELEHEVRFTVTGPVEPAD